MYEIEREWKKTRWLVIYTLRIMDFTSTRITT